MPNMNESDIAFLNLLLEHHRDSFSHIRDREKERDRQFYLFIALLSVLVFVVKSPEIIQSALNGLDIPIVKLDLKTLPSAVFISSVWTFLVALAMRHCQSSVTIERQYSYLHQVEKKMCSLSGDEMIFCREGRAYESNYPLFSWWAYYFYTLLFPTVVIIVVLFMIYVEMFRHGVATYYWLYDVIAAVGIIISFATYRFGMFFTRIYKKYFTGFILMKRG